MRLRDRVWVGTAGLALFASAPAYAYANAGIPMLAVAWPLSWMAFIPIVAIEAAIGRRMAGLSWGRAIGATAAANAVSTLVGIPLAWGALFMVQWIVPNGGGAEYGVDTILGKVWAVTIQAPWLIPWESELHWMIPAALLFTLPLYWIVSVYAERPIFRWIAKCDPAVARSWSWKANITTYAIIAAAVLVWLLAAVIVGA